MTKSSASNRTRNVKSDGSTTLSTRLSHEERELIERAAEIRGWSPSKFVRATAVETAVHLVNAQESSIGRKLESLADSLAKQLWAPSLMAEGDPMYDDPVVPAEWPVVDNDSRHVFASKLTDSELEGLRDGLRYAGAEFLTLLVRAAERHFEDPLPKPIDPRDLNDARMEGQE